VETHRDVRGQPAGTVINDASLLKLAQARGVAIRDALVKDGLDGARVCVAAGISQTATDKLVGSKLSLGTGKIIAVRQ
jgi:hypothetical protein